VTSYSLKLERTVSKHNCVLALCLTCLCGKR